MRIACQLNHWIMHKQISHPFIIFLAIDLTIWQILWEISVKYNIETLNTSDIFTRILALSPPSLLFSIVNSSPSLCAHRILFLCSILWFWILCTLSILFIFDFLGLGWNLVGIYRLGLKAYLIYCVLNLFLSNFESIIGFLKPHPWSYC